MPEDLLEELRAALGHAYEIDQALGGGGMSHVFLARELAIGRRRVVLKVINTDLVGTLNATRFRREIEIAGHLQHPHIVAVLEAGQIGSLIYYTMQYVEGASLGDRLEGARLPLEDALHVLCGVASALAYAHRKGIVHRDIKPDNVLLSGRDAQVTDFGVAKAISEATEPTTLTGTGMAIGTLAYMAPEQIAADPAIDHRVDLYAFGVMAHEILAGQRPAGGVTVRDGALRRVDEDRASIQSLPPHVPPALAALISRCLQFDRESRPGTADEVLQQLEQINASIRHGSKAAGRHRLGAKGVLTVGLIAALLIAIGAVATNALARSHRLNPQRILVAPFDNQTREAAVEPLGQIIADQIARQLMRADFPSLEVVEPNTVRANVQFRGATSHAAEPYSPGSLAAATGAGKVVSGSYYRVGDSLEFQARITDEAAEGKLLRAIEPVRGTANDPKEALKTLQQRVTAGIAIVFDKLPVAPLPREPSLEAYQSYVDGAQKWVRLDWNGAIPSLLRANSLDSTFSLPLLAAGIAEKNLLQWSRADSLAHVVDRHRDQLSSFERHSLDWLIASIRGDRAGRLEAMQAAAQEQPGSDLIQYQLGQELFSRNRPCEAARILEALDTQRGVVRAGWYVYYDYLTRAYHVLGYRRHELRAAQLGREQYPEHLGTIYYEARAHAARGDLTEVERLLDESASRPAESGWSPPDVMINTGLELRAHGHGDAAAMAFSRALRWYGTRPEPERATEAYRFGLARTLYLSGRLGDAATLFDSLSTASPASSTYRGYLGAIAARRGNRDEAQRIAELLAASNQPYLQGENDMWAARIAALLGERDKAVDWLREAFARGAGYEIENHVDIDLESLRSYPPYVELMRPHCSGILAWFEPPTL